VSEELNRWHHVNGPKRERPLSVNWFHLGADVKRSAPLEGVSEDAVPVLDILRSRVSFVTVATIEPRKGHAQTLAAFEQLWSEGMDVNLVFVGKEGWMVEALIEKIRAHSELGKRLFWLEGISDGYLENVYSACRCLIAASIGEGFGLPLIEAAQHKLPIIARDIPVFREVAGAHAFYFSGVDPKDLSDAIKHWIALHKENKHPKSDDMPWFTWKQSTQQLLEKILSCQNEL
jgi:glycosyltransferase involved in cell wall biosynthesis